MIDADGATTFPGRVLAVDHGLRRIGIAISDPLRLFARPLLTLDVTEIESPESRVIELAVEWEASDIVVGVPLLPSGDLGEQGAIALEFIERLRDRLATIAPNISVRTIDESDSTAMAENLRPGLAAQASARSRSRGRNDASSGHATIGRGQDRGRAREQSRGPSVKSPKRRAPDVGLDALAAAVILESWLRES